MGCVTLPGASGVHWVEGDVYRNQRDSGGSTAPAYNNKLSYIITNIRCHSFVMLAKLSTTQILFKITAECSFCHCTREAYSCFSCCDVL